MQTGVIISLAAYFILMLAIGVYAWRKSTADSEGYLLAGRNLSPAVTALSAGASDMSGWLLLGLPGALYVSGLVEAWIGIGLFVGALVNWIVVAPRLRRQTEEYGNALTIPEFLANRFPDKAVALRLTSAVIVVAFFTVYTAAGMVGGGKLFATAFGGDYMTGVWVTTGVVLAYTMVGGFLAVSLTDFVQGLIMLGALVLMPLVVMFGPGGSSGASIAAVPVAGFLSLTEGLTAIGWLSAVTWGLGYFGQPHIIVRFMALRSPREATVARRISLGWMILTAGGAVATALIGIAYFAGDPERPLDDPETVFLLLSQIFFHPFVAGLVLAAVLAAIMSTMSSQLVVCSSALVEDLYNIAGRRSTEKVELVLGRVGVLVVAVVAVLLALDDDSAILDLVAFAWAGFGAAFGPIVLLSLYWRKLTPAGALAGLVTGAVVVLVWGNVAALSDAMYEIVPGFLLNLLVAVLVSRATARPDAAVDAEFDAMEAEVARS